jgi:hypothetical protein
MGFEVLRVVNMKIMIWDACHLFLAWLTFPPCRWTQHISLKYLMDFCWAAWCYNPENNTLHLLASLKVIQYQYVNLIFINE